jgi:TATA-box binding protein (TBP) (component of TFIID and TFIIIB)
MTITTKVAPQINIQNVVTTATFPHRLDLDEIAASLRHIDINPQLRSCIMYRMEDPEAVLWIYSRGVDCNSFCKIRGGFGNSDTQSHRPV